MQRFEHTVWLLITGFLSLMVMVVVDGASDAVDAFVDHVDGIVPLGIHAEPVNALIHLLIATLLVLPAARFVLERYRWRDSLIAALPVMLMMGATGLMGEPEFVAGWSWWFLVGVIPLIVHALFSLPVLRRKAGWYIVGGRLQGWPAVVSIGLSALFVPMMLGTVSVQWMEGTFLSPAIWLVVQLTVFNVIARKTDNRALLACTIVTAAMPAWLFLTGMVLPLWNTI